MLFRAYASPRPCSLSQKKEGSNFTLETEGSGPPSSTTPVEVGGRGKHDNREKVTDYYDTAPGIVFAYQLYWGQEEPLVLLDATKEEIDDDLDEKVEYESLQIGADELCIYLPPKQ